MVLPPVGGGAFPVLDVGEAELRDGVEGCVFATEEKAGLRGKEERGSHSSFVSFGLNPGYHQGRETAVLTAGGKV